MTQKRKASKIPYFFIAFFAVILVVDSFYIYLSKKTWRGIATEDSYHKGLEYNQTIKAVQEQKLLGWKMDIKYRNDGNKAGILIVKLSDKNAAMIKNAKLVVSFKRPTQEGFDFTQDLIFTGQHYQTQILFPLKGQWDFEITAVRANQVLQEVKRYVVQ